MKRLRHLRALKYLLAAFGLLITLGLILVLVAVKVMDDDDYRALAIWSVARADNTRMAVDGVFDVDWSRALRLTATKIRFEDPEGGTPPVTSIRRVHFRIDLPPLLRGILRVKNLEIEGLRMTHLTKDRREALPGSAEWPWGLLIPVVERMALDDLQLAYKNPAGEVTDTVRLDRLSLDDTGDGTPLTLAGHGAFNAEAFRITGRMGGPLAQYDAGRPFPIDLAFKIADLEAALTGTIDHPIEGRGFNLQLAVEEQEMANLVRLFQPDVPSLGRFAFQARFTGDIEALRISDLALDISNGSSIQLSAEGAVPDLATGRGADVTINQKIGEANLLSWLFPEDWQVVEEFNVSAAFHNVDGVYVIEDIDARVVNDKGIVFLAGGMAELGNPLETSLVTAVDLNLHVTAPTSARF